jgi:hypothetical protein
MSLRRAAAAIALVLACALPVRAEPVVPPQLAPLLDAAHDRVVQRAFAPSPEEKVGEVRLIRRGDADVVQTLLYSKLLARVVAEIRRKELANWPAGQPGSEDAQRYVAMLDAVQKKIWDRMPRDEVGADRRQKMGIEFVLTQDAALVVVGAIAIDEQQSDVRVVRFEPLAAFEPSRDYAQRNMRLIAADSFHVDGAAQGVLLAPFPLLQPGETKP